MSDLKKDNSGFTRLKKFFKIGVFSDKNGVKQVYPTEYNPETNRDKRLVFPDYIQKYYDYWMLQCHDNPGSFKNRVDRYNELYYMVRNSALVSRAVEMKAFETSNADSQVNCININAKNKKFNEYLTELILNKWNYNSQRITSIAYDLALLGDSFEINSCEEKKGVSEILPVDAYTIKDRLEFNASRVESQITQKNSFSNYISSYKQLDKLVKVLSDKTDVSKYFKNYLFGYVLSDDQYLPPWAVTHFRMFTTESEFYPFGRSGFINSISPFRQLKASETLQQLLRVSKFPTEVFEVQTDETMTEIEKWNAVNSAREEFYNLNNETLSTTDEFSVNKRIWTTKELIDYKLIENNVDIAAIGDIEMYRKNLASSCGVPLSLLIPEESGGWSGNSGISILQQYKPFAREIFQIQSSILIEIINKVKLHLLLTEDFDIEEEFELSMNYPILEESEDRKRAKTESLNMAKEIISSIASLIGMENETIPVEIVKDIFSKYTFLSYEDVDYMIAELEKNKKSDSEVDNDFGDINQEKIYEKVKTRLNEDVVREVYFNIKNKRGLYEGVQNKMHFVNSKTSNRDIKDLIFMFDNAKKLKD